MKFQGLGQSGQSAGSGMWVGLVKFIALAFDLGLHSQRLAPDSADLIGLTLLLSD